ncbi:hypothetical protein GF382_01405 [Candidatus Falkowbacteria bacterium]|nr:hypothetical protein [Candidatus Falkowbacteria bacterium]
MDQIKFFMFMASRQLERRQYSLAKANCERILESQPRNTKALNSLGLAWLGLASPGDESGPARAISLFEKALKHGAENTTSVRINLALAHKKSGRLQIALNILGNLAKDKGLYNESLCQVVSVEKDLEKMINSLCALIRHNSASGKVLYK